jgi:hypothetical protein
MTTPYPSRYAASRMNPGASSMPGYQSFWTVNASGSALDLRYIKESKRYVRLVRCGFSPLRSRYSYFP